LPSPEIRRKRQIDDLLYKVGLWSAGFPLIGPQIAEADDAVVERAVTEKMLPWLVSYCDAAGIEVSARGRAIAVLLDKVQELRLKGLGTLVDVMHAGRTEVQIFKGLDLQANANPQRLVRQSGDTDLIVRHDQLRHSASLLVKEGFVPGWVKQGRISYSPSCLDFHPPATVIVLVRRMQCAGMAQDVDPQLLARFNFASTAAGIVSYDNCTLSVAAAIDVPEEVLWARPRTTTRLQLGRPIAAPAWTHLLLYQCFELGNDVYFGGPELRQFFDVLTILREHGHEVEWDELVKLAVESRLCGPVYYALTHAREFVSDVPPSVLRACKVHLSQSRFSNTGGFMPVLLRRPISTLSESF
jgi:hypothetical protein